MTTLSVCPVVFALLGIVIVVVCMVDDAFLSELLVDEVLLSLVSGSAVFSVLRQALRVSSHFLVLLPVIFQFELAPHLIWNGTP